MCGVYKVCKGKGNASGKKTVGVSYRLHSSKSILNLTCRSALFSSMIPSREGRLGSPKRLLVVVSHHFEYHIPVTFDCRLDDGRLLLLLMTGEGETTTCICLFFSSSCCPCSCSCLSFLVVVRPPVVVEWNGCLSLLCVRWRTDVVG